MYPHKDNCIPNNIANPDIRYIEGRPGPQGPKGADGVVTFDRLTSEQYRELTNLLNAQ